MLVHDRVRGILLKVAATNKSARPLACPHLPADRFRSITAGEAHQLRVTLESAEFRSDCPVSELTRKPAIKKSWRCSCSPKEQRRKQTN